MPEVNVGDITLIVDIDRRLVRRAEVFQQIFRDLELTHRLRVARIDQDKDYVRVSRLVERRLERLYQVMRKIANKADRVGQQYIDSARQSELPRRRVKRREELVLCENPGVCQAVQQGRFSRVRVTDDCNLGDTGALARLSLRQSSAVEILKLALELFDTAFQVAAVCLEL